MYSYSVCFVSRAHSQQGVCGLLSFHAVCSETEIPLKITELNQLITLITL